MAYELNFPERGAALVLGGSGGAGSAICEALGRAGSSVALTYHRGAARAEATVERLKEIDTPTESYAVDGRDTDSIAAMTKEIVDRFGGIHSVICASGPALEFVPISELSPGRWREYLEEDATSIFNVVHATMPHLREAKGSVTACVTCANRRVLDYDGTSAVPKAAVESLVKQLAAEEGGYGVRANCVGLGWIEVGVGDEQSDRSIHAALGHDAMDALLQVIRLRRPGTGAELASAVVFLASQQASYITGQILTVDGGYSV